MLSPTEKLEALSRGFSLDELRKYQELRGVALIKDLETGAQKIYSYSFAKFLEDRNLAEIISVAETVQELMKNRSEIIRRDMQDTVYKMTIVIERLERILRSSKSGKGELLDRAKIIKRS
ncbi:MAG TPA: hypothetical protein ENF33_01785 [Nitrososphaeria archaeon]|nr:hypothetical protein [Nitrososphaeria archaeon]